MEPKRGKSAHQAIHFNPIWENTYFFVSSGENSQCLICQNILKGKKKHNIERHYNTFHKQVYDFFNGEDRIKKVAELKLQLSPEPEDETIPDAEQQESFALQEPKLKRMKLNPTRENLKFAGKDPESDDDGFLIMVKAYAIKLRKIYPTQRILADKLITDILAEGQLGVLNRSSLILI